MQDEIVISDNLEESGQLTDWSQEPSLMDLKKDLNAAKQSHDEQMSRINKWLDNLYVKGKAKPKVPKGNSEVAPKLIRKQAEWRYSALSEPFLSTPDLFKVRPKTWEDGPGAQQAQLLLNHKFDNAINKVAFIDEYTRTGVDEGTIIVRTGWEYIEHQVTKTLPVYDFIPDPNMELLFADIAELEQSNPAEFRLRITDGLLEAYRMYQDEGVAYRPEYVGDEEREVTETLRNEPTAVICDPENVIIDPTCNGDVSKAKFIIYRYQSSKAELEALGRYKNLDRINLETDTDTDKPDAAYEANKTFNFDDNPRKKITVYEYWGFRDIHGTGRVEPFVASWVGNVTIQMEANPYPDQELPFVIVPYSPVRRHAYGEPDGALLEDNQKIVGAVTRGMIDLFAKSANSQTGIRKGSLDVLNRRRFLDGKDYEFNMSGDPRQAIFMHQFPEIPASAFNILMQQSNDAESMTGVKSFNDGISGQTYGEVAAGVRGAMDASSKREMGMLRRLVSGITQIGQKWLSMCSEFMDDEEIIRVTNDSFVAITREDLQGKFDLSLTISTAEEDNSQAQELAFMLQTMGNTAPFPVIQNLMVKWLRLRKMPEEAKSLSEYQPQPDPYEERIKQLEAEKLIAEIEKITGTAYKERTAGELNMAKAMNVQSDTDQKDLDFIEQENGVKQERQLQLHGEQARSNMQLEVVKNSLQERSKASERLNNFLNM